MLITEILMVRKKIPMVGIFMISIRIVFSPYYCHGHTSPARAYIAKNF